MFKGLTQRAQKVLTIIAQSEAKRFHSDKLHPEHIMLALLKEADGIGYHTLEKLSLEPNQMQLEIEKSVPKQRGGFSLGDVPPSTRGKKVLEDSAEEARNMGHEYIGTEHLLLACVREPESKIARYLAKFQITIEALRDVIIELHEEHRDPEPAGTSVRPKRQLRQHGEQTATGRKATPMLNEFGFDLTKAARVKKLDPVVGRKRETRRIIQILARRTKNNPVLIGDPGVGKTAIVEGLAQLIVSGTAPEVLIGKRLIALDLAGLVAGTKYRGEFEGRLKRLMKEILNAGDVILFIDELHTIIGAGGAEGALDASNMLKPALSRGDIQCIGATTLNEYKKYIERDAALERRFQTIIVEEPSPEETLEILKGIKERYEEHHNVTYTPGALEVASLLSRRYISDRQLPDKAIDLIDETGARKNIDNSVRPDELTQIEQNIEELNNEKLALVNSQNYEQAAALRDKVRQYREQMDTIKKSWRTTLRVEQNIVDSDDVLAVLSDMTGVPLVRIAQKEQQRLLHIEEDLHKTIIGQHEALKAIASSIRRARIGLSAPERPMGSFIFLGPTGVGKSLVAKTLAEFLFGNIDALIRIDMSDYMEKHNVSRLVGAPPGYVGYDEGGLLTEKVRHRPYSVILLDEIEKAHPDVFNILLQVLEEGELQDNLGHTVSFRNTVLIMTSNAGARDILNDSRVGFQNTDDIYDHKQMQSSVMNTIKKIFRPEFLNRVDETVVFHSLSQADMEQILDKLLDDVRRRVADHEIGIKFDKRARAFLMQEGFDAKYGARPLRRTIQKHVEDPLSLELLNGKFGIGDNIMAGIRGGEIKFNMVKSPKEIVVVANETQEDTDA